MRLVMNETLPDKAQGTNNYLGNEGCIAVTFENTYQRDRLLRAGHRSGYTWLSGKSLLDGSIIGDATIGHLAFNKVSKTLTWGSKEHVARPVSLGTQHLSFEDVFS